MNLDKPVPSIKSDEKKSDDKNLNKNSLDLPPIVQSKETLKLDKNEHLDNNKPREDISAPIESGKVIYIREGAKESIKDHLDKNDGAQKLKDHLKNSKENVNKNSGEINTETLKDDGIILEKKKDNSIKPVDDVS